MTWVGPCLDVAVVGLLAAVLWRLGRDPVAAWGEREARLQTIFEELRGLVAQSEGLARDLDEKLAERERRLRALLGEAEQTLIAKTDASVAGRTYPPVATRGERADARDESSSAAADPALIASRIEALAATGTAVEEIARRVGVATAEVRLVIGLKAARAARQRIASEGTHVQQ